MGLRNKRTIAYLQPQIYSGRVFCALRLRCTDFNGNMLTVKYAQITLETLP